MKWLKEDDVRTFLLATNYDVRTSGNARWLDQKCAADVVTIVSDCILQYADSHPSIYFSSMDVWHNQYTIVNVESIFKKPNPDEIKARNEYDKFFQQPMEMLAYSGVLLKQKQGNRNYYRVKERDVLEYLSIRERNALTFLQLYITKVLTDSGIMSLFANFFDKQTESAYYSVKDGFTDFTISNTKINKITECRRIFIKVLNPLAYQLDKRGTEGGHLSKNKITYDMLMYNRDNFRDISSDKPKELTRRQYTEQVGLSPSSSLTAYMSQKAKRLVRTFNDTYCSGRSEVYDERHNDDIAIHIHHIFPEAEFPEICAFYENLIALTPTQHYSYAHPQGNTSKVDLAYQQICLLAKAGTIKDTLEDLSRDQIYEFARFMYTLFIGLDDGIFMNIVNRDFDSAVSAINRAYA